MSFWPPYCERKANLSKKFRPSNRAEVFIWENFHPGYRDLGSAFSYEHIAIFTKDIGVSRDLGNRASPVNGADMKRPSGTKTPEDVNRINVIQFASFS